MIAGAPLSVRRRRTVLGRPCLAARRRCPFCPGAGGAAVPRIRRIFPFFPERPASAGGGALPQRHPAARPVVLCGGVRRTGRGRRASGGLFAPHADAAPEEAGASADRHGGPDGGSVRLSPSVRTAAAAAGRTVSDRGRPGLHERCFSQRRDAVRALPDTVRRDRTTGSLRGVAPGPAPCPGCAEAGFPPAKFGEKKCPKNWLIKKDSSIFVFAK